MIKDVEDCVLVMNIICGYDLYDVILVLIEVFDFIKVFKNDVKGFKIGVLREYMEKGVNDEVKKVVEKVFEFLKFFGV